MVPWLLFVAAVAEVLRVTAVRSEVEELDTLEGPKKTSGDLPRELSRLTENLSEGCQIQMSILFKDLLQKCHEAHAPMCQDDLIDMMVKDEYGGYGTRDFLRNDYEWFKKLAATEQDGMLWAGFWPGGEPQRTSKDALMDFAKLMDKQVVHPNSKLGRIIVGAGDLAKCGQRASDYVTGFWTHASQAFVAQMLRENQRSVLMLVNKDLNPFAERSFQKSILGDFELPNLGMIVVRTIVYGSNGRKSDPWLPQLVVVDLKGTCKDLENEIRHALQRDLSLAGNKDAFRNAEYAASLSWLKHKPVICKNCVSPCKLDQKLATELKKDVGSAEKSFQEKVQKFGSFQNMIQKEKAKESADRRAKDKQRSKSKSGKGKVQWKKMDLSWS